MSIQCPFLEPALKLYISENLFISFIVFSLLTYFSYYFHLFRNVIYFCSYFPILILCFLISNFLLVSILLIFSNCFILAVLRMICFLNKVLWHICICMFKAICSPWQYSFSLKVWHLMINLFNYKDFIHFMTCYRKKYYLITYWVSTF